MSMNNESIFIAEPKTISPFGFKSNYSQRELQFLAINNGDWISVHTNEFWGGSVADLPFIKDHLIEGKNQKILAKGLHLTDKEVDDCFKYGADYVLVVGRIPKIHLNKCLLEPIHEEQAREMSKTNCHALVLNNRRLRDGGENGWTWKPGLLQKLADNKSLIYASNIKSYDFVNSKDFKSYFSGYIVGANLPQFIISKQIQELLDVQGKK